MDKRQLKIYLSPLAKQEWDSMQKEVCPKCSGKLRASMRKIKGYGGSRFKWRCINPDCDQVGIGKTDTQIAARLIKE